MCWRWCCLPSITPPLCPQVTQTHWDDCQELGRDAPRHFCDTVSVTGVIGLTRACAASTCALIDSVLVFLSLFYTGLNIREMTVCVLGFFVRFRVLSVSCLFAADSVWVWTFFFNPVKWVTAAPNWQDGFQFSVIFHRVSVCHRSPSSHVIEERDGTEEAAQQEGGAISRG